MSSARGGFRIGRRHCDEDIGPAELARDSAGHGGDRGLVGNVGCDRNSKARTE
jgi:hypothetical protein